MTIRFVDAIFGIDTDDGLTEETAKKNLSATAQSPGDLIILLPGEYPSSLGKFTFSAVGFAVTYRAKYKWTVIIKHDLAGPYVTLSGTVTHTVNLDGLVLRDFSDDFTNTTTTGGNPTVIDSVDCKWLNMKAIMTRDASSRRLSHTAVRDVFADCVPGVALWQDLNTTSAVFKSNFINCVFSNINVGAGDFIDLAAINNSFQEDCVGNSFRAITAARIWRVSVADTDVALSDHINGNIYDEASFTLSTGFGKTGTEEKATFANWTTDTVADQESINADPELFAPADGGYGPIPFGNSDRTGIGESVIGAFQGRVMLGWGKGVNSATHWDNATLDGGIPSRGTLTLDTQVIAGDTMTLDGKVYIFQANGGLTDVDGNIEIGSDLAGTKLNIFNAVNLLGTPGTGYALSMTEHTTMWIHKFIVNNALVQAKVGGIGGNSLATTETFTPATNIFDATNLGTLRAGANHTVIQGGSGLKFCHSGTVGSWERIELPELDAGELVDLFDLLSSGIQDGDRNRIGYDGLRSRMIIELRHASTSILLASATYERVNVGRSEQNEAIITDRFWQARVTLVDDN